MGSNQSSTQLPRESSSYQNKSLIDSVSSGTISPLSEEMPYYMYKMGKPIGDENKKLNAATTSAYSKSLTFASIKDLKNLVNKSSVDLDKVTIVSTGPNKKCVENDPYIQKLSQIPLSLPILRKSLKYPLKQEDYVFMNDVNNIKTSLHQKIIRLINLYQNHLYDIVKPLQKTQENSFESLANIRRNLHKIMLSYREKNEILDKTLRLVQYDKELLVDKKFENNLFNLDIYTKLYEDIEKLYATANHLNNQLPPNLKLSTTMQ